MPPHARQRRLGERVEVKHEADDGGGGVFVAVELWRIHGEDCELIMVWRIAFGRTRAAVAGDTEIGAALHRALRRAGALRIACALGKARYVRRDIEDDPVPETASRWRVGIVNRERKALRVLRRSRPGQCWRDVAARAAKAVKDLLVGDARPRSDVWAGQGHRLGGGGLRTQ